MTVEMRVGGPLAMTPFRGQDATPMARLFRRVLVPHDLSEPAARALEVAADLAERAGGRLVVLHVLTPFEPATGFTDAATWVPERELMAGARKTLRDMVERTLGRRRASKVEYRVTLGDPYRRITDPALRVDSIVMSTAGRTGMSHLVIGSVAEKVVRHARVPVLTIGPAPKRRRPRATTRRRRRRAARR